MPSNASGREVIDGHLNDADMLRHLDDEGALPGGLDAESHLRACSDCAARADVLRRRRLALARLLADADPSPARVAIPESLLARARARDRTRWFPSRSWRVAAALLVAVSLAAQPLVRRWVGAQWKRVSSDVHADQHAPSAATPGVSAPVSAPGAVLTLEPAPGPFTIEFDVRPAFGSLTIVRGAGTVATVERLQGASPELVVTTRGLRVRSSANDTLRYLVRLPRAVVRVYVRTGDAPSASDRVIDLGDREERINFAAPVPGKRSDSRAANVRRRAASERNR